MTDLPFGPIVVKDSEGGRNFLKFVGIAGVTTALEICRQMGGTNLYIPRMETLIRRRRSVGMWMDHEVRGMSKRKIAIKWNVSRQRVIKALREVEARYGSKLERLLDVPVVIEVDGEEKVFSLD